MSDPHPILSGAPTSPESPSQLVAALAIIAGVVIIAIASLIIGYMANQLPASLAIVSTVIGGLLTALQAPSGVAKLIGAARSQNPKDPTA